MNILKNIFLVSALSIGVSHAGTVPCNGFKIKFNNNAAHNLIIDNAHLSGGNISTTDSTVIEMNNSLEYTVNQTLENGVMTGEFLFHTVAEPAKTLKLNFSLTNKDAVCEVNNFSKEGALDTNITRVLGGILLPISE